MIISSNYFEYYSSCSLDLNIDNEEIEEGESITVVGAEQASSLVGKYSSRNTMRPTSKCISIPIIISSILGEVDGSQTINDRLSNYLCSLGDSLCKFIAIKPPEIEPMDIIKGAFDYAKLKLEEGGKKTFFGFSFPLVLPSNISSKIGNNKTVINVITEQLLYMRYYISFKFNEFQVEDQDDEISTTCIFRKFCDDEYSVNADIYYKCCSDITSYINYADIPPATIPHATAKPNITTSSTLRSKTSSINVETTALLKTEVISVSRNRISVICVALVASLLLGVTIISFMRKGICKKPDKVNQPQSVLNHSDDASIEELAEDIV